MTDEQTPRAAELQPRQIVEFIDRLAYWKADTMSPADITFHNYPTVEARTLGLAKRALETLLTWKQGAGPVADLERLVALLAGKLKTAVVDKDAGRVEFRFLGSELIELRSAVPALMDYAAIKARDAQEAARPKYQKRKR